MADYYARKLAGERLRLCYELAPPRVRQYLQAEIRFVMGKLQPHDFVLELGCGYGRVASELARVAKKVVGIDTSRESLAMARAIIDPDLPCEFFDMDATNTTFPDNSFDLVACVQNGICAFNVDTAKLLREALRVTCSPGRILFSSYSERFWEERLEWFRIQAAHGLIGEIDEEASGNGFIVCRDGFRAGAMSEADFRTLCSRVGVKPEITEVDGSSVFCEIRI